MYTCHKKCVFIFCKCWIISIILKLSRYITLVGASDGSDNLTVAINTVIEVTSCSGSGQYQLGIFQEKLNWFQGEMACQEAGFKSLDHGVATAHRRFHLRQYLEDNMDSFTVDSFWTDHFMPDYSVDIWVSYRDPCRQYSKNKFSEFATPSKQCGIVNVNSSKIAAESVILLPSSCTDMRPFVCHNYIGSAEFDRLEGYTISDTLPEYIIPNTDLNTFNVCSHTCLDMIKCTSFVYNFTSSECTYYIFENGYAAATYNIRHVAENVTFMRKVGCEINMMKTEPSFMEVYPNNFTFVFPECPLYNDYMFTLTQTASPPAAFTASTTQTMTETIYLHNTSNITKELTTTMATSTSPTYSSSPETTANIKGSFTTTKALTKTPTSSLVIHIITEGKRLSTTTQTPSATTTRSSAVTKTTTETKRLPTTTAITSLSVIKATTEPKRLPSTTTSSPVIKTTTSLPVIKTTTTTTTTLSPFIKTTTEPKRLPTTTTSSPVIKTTTSSPFIKTTIEPIRLATKTTTLSSPAIKTTTTTTSSSPFIKTTTEPTLLPPPPPTTSSYEKTTTEPKRLPTTTTTSSPVIKTTATATTSSPFIKTTTEPKRLPTTTITTTSSPVIKATTTTSSPVLKTTTEANRSSSTTTSNVTTPIKTLYITTCHCPDVSQGSLQEVFEQLVANLTVNRKETSLYRRSVSSAKDNRPLAITAGLMGAVFIVASLGLIVLSDMCKWVNKRTGKTKSHDIGMTRRGGV